MKKAPSGGSDLGRLCFGSPPNCTLLWRGRLTWEGGGGGHQAPATIPATIPLPAPVAASFPVSLNPLQAFQNLLPFLLCYDMLGLVQVGKYCVWKSYICSAERSKYFR